MSNNNDSYYYKYLKYKKKYLELLEGGSPHRHNKHNKHNKHQSLYPKPIFVPKISSPRRIITSPPRRIIPSPPRIISSPPRIISSPPRIIPSPPRRIITSPRLIISPPRRIISQPLIITSPQIISSPVIFSNKTDDNYNEFNSAFNFFNKKFDKDTFINIFNSNYIIGSKNYKGKYIVDIQREKELLISYFISEKIWTINIINTFEILMNKLQIKLFLSPDQRIDFQEKIKKYIVLNELSNIIL